MTILITTGEGEYSFLLEKLGLTDGNLATYLKKLEKAKYIRVRKSIIYSEK